MYRFELQQSFRVPEVRQGGHISIVSPDRIWISDSYHNLVLSNTASKEILLWKCVGSGLGIHSLNSNGDIIYLQNRHDIYKLSKDYAYKEVKSITKPWEARCVYSSLSTGDLLVGMCHTDTYEAKIVRFNSTGENIQTIQHDKKGQELYGLPSYITENRNGDMIVSDVGRAVVVTDRGGKYRFSYTGPPSGSRLSPRGICTDALSHILLCDVSTRSVQMLDRDGKFLSQTFTYQDGIETPCSLCFDDNTNKLWVGSYKDNKVNIYRILQGDFTTDSDEQKKKRRDFPDEALKLKSISHQQKHGEKQITVNVSHENESLIHRYDIGAKLITKKGSHVKEDVSESETSDEGSAELTDFSDKRENGKKTKQNERTPLHSELFSFEEKLKQLRKNGEIGIRVQHLTDSLDIEQTHPELYQRGQKKTTEYVNILRRVDYLDCLGLGSSDVEKLLKGFEQFSKFHDDGDVENISSIIHHCMDYAIENENHIIVLELVRKYIFSFDFHLQKRFEDKNINSGVIDTILQTAKCMIFSTCPGLRQNALSLSFCIECSQEKPLVMMMSYKGILEIKDLIPKKAMGLNLVVYNYTQPSDEAYTVFNSTTTTSSGFTLPVITEQEAKKLFKKHSNLTLISASQFKSKGYSKGKHRVIEKLCISLLCLHKGYIPFGEREFPKEINGFDVDVQEGHCSFGRGRSIDFGGHIRRAGGINMPENGSIGGFVNLEDGSVGLITCAHVVFSSDELKLPNEEILKNMPDLKVECFDKKRHRYHLCGKILNKSFPLSSTNKSVDAALIKLDPTVEEFLFPVTDQLYSAVAGFDTNRPPIFTGEVVSIKDPDPFLKISNRIPGKSDKVIKYGSKTGFTVGNLYFNRAHIRFVDDIGNLPDNTCTTAVMSNQIEIQSLPYGMFFESGDSGSFVFCINPEKTLSCLGMAIGSTTKGTCFVTPMTKVLDAFDLPHELKRAPSGSQSSQQSNVSSQFSVEAILFKSLTDIQNHQRNIQSSLYSVQTDVGNLRTEVQEKFEIRRWDFQTEFRSLIWEVQAEFKDRRWDVRTEIRKLRREVQDEFEKLRAEVMAEYETLRTQVETEAVCLKVQVKEIKEKLQTRASGRTSGIKKK